MGVGKHVLAADLTWRFAQPPEELLQALELSFFISALALGTVLTSASIFRSDIALMSALALLPATAGMAIGRYYQHQHQYVGAINRYRIVIERYQTTTHVPEALHRLVESYLALGVQSEAKETAAVLGHNFPGSDWYADSYFLITGEDYRFDEK